MTKKPCPTPDLSALPQFLRGKDIYKPHGILPIVRQTWENWQKRGIVSEGIKINGSVFWLLAEIEDLLKAGMQRETQTS